MEEVDLSLIHHPSFINESYSTASMNEGGKEGGNGGFIGTLDDINPCNTGRLQLLGCQGGGSQRTSDFI